MIPIASLPAYVSLEIPEHATGLEDFNRPHPARHRSDYHTVCLTKSKYSTSLCHLRGFLSSCHSTADSSIEDLPPMWADDLLSKHIFEVSLICFAMLRRVGVVILHSEETPFDI